MLTGPDPRSSILSQRLERCRHYIGWARWRLGLSTQTPSTVPPEDHIVYLEQQLKAARGSASASMKKSLAQGLELDALQKAHVRTVAQLRLVNHERDELKEILRLVAPVQHDLWILAKQAARPPAAPPPPATFFGGAQGRGWTDIPQTKETHGD